MSSFFRVQSPKQYLRGFDQRRLRHVSFGGWRDAAEDLDRGLMLVSLRQCVEGVQELLHGHVHRSSPQNGPADDDTDGRPLEQRTTCRLMFLERRYPRSQVVKPPRSMTSCTRRNHVLA